MTWAIDRPGPTVTAPTVVLLHGLTATGSSNWGSIIDSLAVHYRVVALDHRGHGKGIRPPDRFTLEDCADDVARLLEELGIPRAVLVGYSMGGAIGQLTWRRHPRMVAGLVLLATAARFDRPIESQLLRGLVADAARFGDLLALTSHSLTAVHQAAEALTHYDARPWLGEILVPAEVLVTTKDRVVAPRRQRELADLVTDGRTTDLAGGHLLPITNRRLTATAIEAACERVVTRAGLDAGRWGRLRATARRLARRWRRWRRRRHEAAQNTV